MHRFACASVSALVHRDLSHWVVAILMSQVGGLCTIPEELERSGAEVQAVLGAAPEVWIQVSAERLWP